jgi:hypothetical protein
VIADATLRAREVAALEKLEAKYRRPLLPVTTLKSATVDLHTK